MLYAMLLFPVGLWGVVNNAGYNMLGDIELCTMDMYKSVAEVNLFGMVRVTRAFLPLIRKQTGELLTKIRNMMSYYDIYTTSQ
jgi:NAD(P)-dependent dehydrogenase (short-subunit alcohol dehydrogenase family)